MNETQESIVWVESEVTGIVVRSEDGRFCIERRKDRHFDLYDTSPNWDENVRGVCCNAKRLSLKACKALAEEIVAGEKEDNQTKEGEESHPPTNVVSQNEDILPPGSVRNGVITTSEEVHVPTNLSTKARETVRHRTFTQPAPRKEVVGFNLSKILAPSMVPFRVLAMGSAESRTKTKSRGMKIEGESLRGGITDKVVNPVPVVYHKLKTREEVQQILNRLMVEKGVNLPNWADWIPILRENGVDPIEVRQGMLAIAEKWAREHAEEEAAKKRQPRQVALEHLPPGTTFRIPSMADTFDVGVLLDKNPASAKVRITQGCKDREIDWSLGTLVVVVGKVELEKHRPSGDNETQALKVVEDVLPPWETTEDEMKIRIDVAKKLLTALGLAATAVKKMSAKKVATKINSIEKHLEEADKVEGENLKLLEKIADWRQKNADGTIKIVGGEEEESPDKESKITRPDDEEPDPISDRDLETEMEGEEVKETKEKAPKGKKAKPEKAPKEEVQEKPSKKTKPKTEENGKEEKKTKTGKARVEGNGKTPREGSMVDIILNRLKKGPVSKDDLLKAVDQAFPGRDPKTQKNTVQWQLATGIPRKGIKVEKNEDGKFFVKK